VVGVLGVCARGSAAVRGEDGADRAAPWRKERGARTSERVTTLTSQAHCAKGKRGACEGERCQQVRSAL
jgi:hypothetical protein